MCLCWLSDLGHSEKEGVVQLPSLRRGLDCSSFESFKRRLLSNDRKKLCPFQCKGFSGDFGKWLASQVSGIAKAMVFVGFNSSLLVGHSHDPTAEKISSFFLKT